MKKMIACFLIGAIFLISAKSQAVTAQFFLLNPEMRLEKNSSQQYQDMKPLNFSGGLQGATLAGLLEYSRYRDETGNSTSSIERDHQELLAWLKYKFFNYQYSTQGDLSLNTGAGAGIYREEIKTTLMSVSRNDVGSDLFVSGLTVGGQVTYRMGGIELVSAIDGRILFAADFDPNPLLSVVLRLGIQIPL